MATQVNIQTSNWQALGTNAPCPQFQMTVSATWVDDAGVPRSGGPLTITFPNVIGQMTVAEKAWFAERMQDVLIEIARRRAGIDA